jgi:hypothetical protein
VLLADSFDRLDELDVDLNRVARLLLLIALPPFPVALVALRSGNRFRLARFRIRQIPEGLTETS